MADINGAFLNSLFSTLLKKIIVPSDFHGQVAAIKEMLGDDVSGLVDSLTDFSVQTAAAVDFNVETNNPELTKLLKKWLDNINSSYLGQIPRGIKALSQEYFKERWKSSSFPILKLVEWAAINKINVPTKMFFVDGGSVYSEALDKKAKTKSIIGYKYFLGADKNDSLDKGVIINRPFMRWFDEYPVPFLIKRGVYHNFKIIESLKKRETEILEQIIPYLLTIKKGDIALATNNIKTYSEPELTKVKDQFQALMDKMNLMVDGKIKSPIRVTQFDEEIKHLIPDLSSIFSPDLFASAERNILGGLGYIDVVSSISSSRKESILSPRPFIAEVTKGVEDFKEILREIVAQIIENNIGSHKKYMSENITFNITASPIKGFATDEFKAMIRSLYDRGAISKQTAVEVIGELDFEVEVTRREQESRRGLDLEMYPPVIVNDEEFPGADIPDTKTKPMTPEDKTKENIPDDKKGIEKKNFKMASIESAIYKELKDLPEVVRKKLNLKQQKKWMDIFNSAYAYALKKTGNKKNAETYAFRVAYSQLK